MFDISFWELLLIFIVALFVLGPERIPKVAYMIGRWIKYFRNSYYAVSAEINQQVQEEFESKNKSKEITEDKEP